MAKPSKQQLARVRFLVDRVCSALSLISQHATLCASGPEPELGASHVIVGLEDIKAELEELAPIVRRWHRDNDASTKHIRNRA